MPGNVFLHYLQRVRRKIPGEHTEDIWLQCLPKKLKESVLTELQQDDADFQQDKQEVIMHSNLAFGWGVHILDRPNNAMICLVVAISMASSFVLSCMTMGFAKTQEHFLLLQSMLPS
jgi:hypothetical protein